MYVFRPPAYSCNQLPTGCCHPVVNRGGFLGKRRKIRCTFSSGNSATCVWCLAHDSACVSQQYQDDGSNHSRSPHMEERMLRVEGLLERVLEKLEAGARHTQTTEPSEHATTTEDSTGIDVINTASISAPSSTSNVVSVFRSASVGYFFFLPNPSMKYSLNISP